MKFEERLNELISQAEVPDELLPENIAAMLKAKTEQTHIKAEKKNIKTSANVYAQRRTIIMNTRSMKRYHPIHMMICIICIRIYTLTEAIMTKIPKDMATIRLLMKKIPPNSR